MRMIPYLALLASGPAALCFAAWHQDQWPVRERETIQKTLTLSGEPMRLVIDNLDGYVHVTGANGSQVQVTAHKLIRAETESDLQQAKNEVKLDMTEQPGTVTIYYDAPWRCDGGNRGCRGEHRRFYEVTYDIDVQAPRNARVVASTVNGHITVDDISGPFDASDVNGPIHMTGMAGSGDAHTVNGPITVRFARNPSEPCSFKTVNGQLDIYFQPDLSADLLFKTFNGAVYSDFDVTPLATATPAVEKNGRFVYRSSREGAARVGKGGPELKFDSFNGSIRLHKEKQQ